MSMDSPPSRVWVRAALSRRASRSCLEVLRIGLVVLGGQAVKPIEDIKRASAKKEGTRWVHGQWPQLVSVSASVALLILAVRSSLSQLKGLPSMARLTVLKRTMEKTWR